jgi:hypothetical protein
MHIRPPGKESAVFESIERCARQQGKPLTASSTNYIHDNS